MGRRGGPASLHPPRRRPRRAPLIRPAPSHLTAQLVLHRTSWADSHGTGGKKEPDLLRRSFHRSVGEGELCLLLPPALIPMLSPVLLAALVLPPAVSLPDRVQILLAALVVWAARRAGARLTRRPPFRALCRTRMSCTTTTTTKRQTGQVCPETTCSAGRAGGEGGKHQQHRPGVLSVLPCDVASADPHQEGCTRPRSACVTRNFKSAHQLTQSTWAGILSLSSG